MEYFMWRNMLYLWGATANKKIKKGDSNILKKLKYIAVSWIILNWSKMKWTSWNNWMKKKSIMKSRIWSLDISIITSKSGKSMLRSNLLSLTILQN
jgi:hypothetical protein